MLHKSGARCLAVAGRQLAVALLGVTAGLGCRPSRPGGDGEGVQLRTVLEQSRRQNGRAGLEPAPIKGGEFGIIDAARMSPDGKWIVVSDESAPYIKVVDNSGTTSAVIGLRSGSQGQQLMWPVIAISNHDVLVVRPELRRVERYGLDGVQRGVFDALDFQPITATALTDSVWLMYGPSDVRTDSGATWLHCLYFGSSSRVYWRNALRDEVDSVSGAMTNSAAPFVSGTSAILEHRQRHGAMLVSVDCGTGDRAADPLWSIEARASNGKSTGTIPSYHELSGVAGASLTRLGKALWTISTDNTPAVTFQRVDREGSPLSVRAPGDYRVMDSRAGRGVLLSSDVSVPMLFLVPDASIEAALDRGSRTAVASRRGR
jgi:hypothetical protein